MGTIHKRSRTGGFTTGDLPLIYYPETLETGSSISVPSGTEGAGPSGTEVTRNRSHDAEPKDAVPSGAENCGTEI